MIFYVPICFSSSSLWRKEHRSFTGSGEDIFIWRGPVNPRWVKQLWSRKILTKLTEALCSPVMPVWQTAHKFASQNIEEILVQKLLEKFSPAVWQIKIRKITNWIKFNNSFISIQTFSLNNVQLKFKLNFIDSEELLSLKVPIQIG